ncbi:hypothetical protein ACFYNO_32635 [Kitasatospora sp. NPDC006697]|uniref:hypothetical protein n=1 Tax=Kitasatospora sp. NPDC006697 TaxID=3364020 RepID=UPI003678B786
MIVTQIMAFSTGLTFDLEIRFNASDTSPEALVELKRLMRNQLGTAGGLQISLEYPGGPITHLAMGTEDRVSAAGPHRSGLVRHASSSGPIWRLGYWVRSLPAEGDSILSLVWLDQGIEPTQFIVPSALVRLAEAQIRRLWETAVPG